MAALERQQQHSNQNGHFEGWEKPSFLQTNPKLDGVVVIIIKIYQNYARSRGLHLTFHNIHKYPQVLVPLI
jgi:hypothetical protein